MPYSCLNNYAKIKYLLSNFTGFIYIYMYVLIFTIKKGRQGEGRGGEGRFTCDFSEVIHPLIASNLKTIPPQ